MKTYFNCLLLIMSLFLAGCATPLQVKLAAARHLNPDATNHSLPVQVRIYQLRDNNDFRQATFTELWQNDREALGSSLLSRREISLAPGAKTQLNLMRNPEATYIGAIAIFRKPQAGHWRGYKRIGRSMPLTHTQMQISLIGNRLRMH